MAALYDLNEIAFPDARAGDGLSNWTGASTRKSGPTAMATPFSVRWKLATAVFSSSSRDAIEIVDDTGDAPKQIVIHGPGQFAGDVSQITGQPAIVSGIARGDTNVYAVTQRAA